MEKSTIFDTLSFLKIAREKKMAVYPIKLNQNLMHKLQ